MSKDQVYEKLSAPFPKEAMTSDSSRGFALTSIKAQYVRERLNEVLGVNGWSSNTEVVDRTDEGVAVKLVLTAHIDGKDVSRSSFGGASKKNKGQTYGDLFKSAETDALSKAASNFGVGNDVFKGLVDPKTLSTKSSGSSAPAKKTSSAVPEEKKKAPAKKTGFRKPKSKASPAPKKEESTDEDW